MMWASNDVTLRLNKRRGWFRSHPLMPKTDLEENDSLSSGPPNSV